MSFQRGPTVRAGCALTIRAALTAALSMGAAALAAGGTSAPRPSVLRPVTVADSIAMSRPAAPGLNGNGSDVEVAQFSPAGEQFVVVVRKGNVARNTNDYSIYLFRASEALSSPKPDLLLTMASSTNNEAVKDLRWLNDNETFAFIGEQSGKPAQVFTFNVRTRQLSQRTSHATAIDAFAMTGDGNTLVYVAEAPRQTIVDPEREIVINGQGLDTLLAADASYTTSDSSWMDQLFSQRGQSPAVQVPVRESIFFTDSAHLYLSPNGRYCVLATLVEQTPAWWREYKPSEEIEDLGVKMQTTPRHRSGDRNLATQLLLVDTEKNVSETLLDTPLAAFAPLAWGADSRSVYVKAFLPLNITDSAERDSRSKQKEAVELGVPGGDVIKKLSDEEWKAKTETAPKHPAVVVSIEEDPNTPPSIFASNPKTRKKVLLVELNPQFRDLQFGKMEVVEWTVTPKIRAKGGLYFPPDYKPGNRYPLVIQTHGFDEHKFSMDGLELHSAHAARALAAKGFLVLQAYGLDRVLKYEDYKEFGTTPAQAGDRCEIAITEAVVDYLNARGLIDPDRVGIAGFSISVSDVAYMLTHPKHRYAAAILTQGVDWGYFQRVVYPATSYQADQVNGGTSPFGPGLQAWLDAPDFNLDKVTTPVRLVELNRASVLELWGWYVGLSEQDKPVDYVLLPDGTHILFKPYERQVVQQGLVDWFRFWLQGAEDPDSAKTDEYRRWEKLCDLQKAQNPDRPTFCVGTKH